MNTKTKLRSLLRAMRNPVPSCKLQLFYGLPGGFRVHSRFGDLVRKRIADVAPFLARDGAYTPAQLLGPDLWSALNDAEARMAKLCVAAMVTKGEVALKVADSDGDGAATYSRLNY